MSSVRRSKPNKTYRERSQNPNSRPFGLIEKHKDYVLRARDFRKKQTQLKALRERAYHRNPDEFYFGMIHAKVKDGVHQDERLNNYSNDFILMLKTQDLKYVQNLRNIERKKIIQLKESLHLLDQGVQVSNDRKYQTNEDDDPSTSQPKHTVFVDNEEELEKFDPAKYFDTVPELTSRTFNRPRLHQLETASIPKLSVKQQQRHEKQRDSVYQELLSRLDRDKQLAVVEKELRLQRSVHDKGGKTKLGTDEDGVPIIKFHPIRKK
ncbi:hypothetical protein IWQ61_000654 [Dispira simplex]|nr:hypothetical protein IWQ61_000654 [Dispira simplex]